MPSTRPPGGGDVSSAHPEELPVRRAAEALSRIFGPAPEVALVLGSGLGPVVDRIEVSARATAADVHLPSSEVIGHAGTLLRGRLGRTEVVVLSGRVHVYGGWTPAEVVRYVRALHVWGVKSLVLTCSSGSVHAELGPGDIVVVTDHLNFQGCSPLVGPPFGERFPDPSKAYDPALTASLLDALEAAGRPRHTGVYAAMLGPAYESSAEIRMLHRLGADIVGMSTVPEVLAALEVGMSTAVVSVVSNYGTGVTPEAVDHAAVTRVAGEAASSLAEALEVFLGRP